MMNLGSVALVCLFATMAIALLHGWWGGMPVWRGLALDQCVSIVAVVAATVLQRLAPRLAVLLLSIGFGAGLYWATCVAAQFGQRARHRLADAVAALRLIRSERAIVRALERPMLESDVAIMVCAIIDAIKRAEDASTPRPVLALVEWENRRFMRALSKLQQYP